METEVVSGYCIIMKMTTLKAIAITARQVLISKEKYESWVSVLSLAHKFQVTSIII